MHIKSGRFGFAASENEAFFRKTILKTTYLCGRAFRNVLAMVGYNDMI